MTLPEEFVITTRQLLGEEYDAFEKSLSQPSPVSIRWNPAKSANPNDNKIPWASAGQYLAERPVFTLDPLFHAGAYYVQEASSMLLEQVIRQSISLKDDLAVLDLCAAPGGKSTHLASLLTDKSLLVCNEVIRSRAGILAENMQKWGYPNTVITNNDPQDFDSLHFQFDVIVVDAPCSGEGLFRKDPDATKEWSPDNVKLCAARQQRILADVWEALKPGGVLIYSTCTYNPQENEQNLAWLSDQLDAKPLELSIDPVWGFNTAEVAGITGFHAYPNKVKGEGFFITAVHKSDGKEKRLKRTKYRHPYVHKKLIPQFNSWIHSAEERFFIQHKETILALPEAWHNELLDINQNLHIITEGLKVGDEKKNKIVPDQALALSTLLNPDSFNLTALGRQEALLFLKKDTLDSSLFKEGLNLVAYKNHPIGWGKRIGNRFNNSYPTPWRIRMNLD